MRRNRRRTTLADHARGDVRNGLKRVYRREIIGHLRSALPTARRHIDLRRRRVTDPAEICDIRLAAVGPEAGVERGEGCYRGNIGGGLRTGPETIVRRPEDHRQEASSRGTESSDTKAATQRHRHEGKDKKARTPAPSLNSPARSASTATIHRSHHAIRQHHFYGAPPHRRSASRSDDHRQDRIHTDPRTTIPHTEKASLTSVTSMIDTTPDRRCTAPLANSFAELLIYRNPANAVVSQKGSPSTTSEYLAPRRGTNVGVSRHSGGSSAAAVGVWGAAGALEAHVDTEPVSGEGEPRRRCRQRRQSTPMT